MAELRLLAFAFWYSNVSILIMLETILLVVVVVIQIFLLVRKPTEIADSAEKIAPLLERTERALRDEVARSREDAHTSAREGREELGRSFNQLRESVESRLQRLQDDNNRKLEEMRATVDEKLHATLERRLGDSFKLVSERLELVHKGLGEMQTLAAGVGDLKKILSNVKTRGTWGEVALENLLEQILTPDQYERNVATKPGSAERVDFAIRLPGRGDIVWLPIDAKFPQEDYLKLVEAAEQANPVLVAEAGKLFENRIKSEAKSIKEKYIAPPGTTDFAILFLPAESLYAEALRRPGLSEILQREHRVVLTGPTTLAALLNSLQMGFLTLKIEERSSAVWRILGGVKTEFGKFGDMLDKTKKKLQEATNTIDDAATRSRAIQKQLKDVEELPGSVDESLPVIAISSDHEKSVDESPFTKQ